MKITGNFTFEAPRDEVWAALNDPEVLARTIPGCQKLEQVGDNEFESTLKVGLQAVKGVYHGRVQILDLDPPQGYRLMVNGKGNNGFIKGEGSIQLRETGQTTILEYNGEAQVGGTIASVGQRLLDGAAKTLINQSLKALAAQLEGRRQGVAEAEITTPTPEVVVAAPIPVDAPTVAPTPAEPPPPAAEPSFERRSIVVPEHEQLTEVHVARGIVDDFVRERPWLPWVLVAFLLGYLLGQRKK